jgi:hypothetical protein
MKGKLAKVEADLLSAWEALKIEQHEHSELRTTIGLVCGALGAIEVRLRVSSLWSHLGAAFERVRTQVKEALHLRVHRALVVFKSHYEKIDLKALNEGYVEAPDEEHDAIDEEVLEPAKTMVAMFEDEVVPLPLEL